jgi:ribonuclease T1
MAGTATGRQRYQWLLLLVAAVILVAWFFLPTSDDPDGSGQGATSGSTSAAPSATDSDDGTGSPPTAGGTDPDSGLPYVDESRLPSEAQDVLERIDAGGPFKYPDNDGVVFENREDLLPDQPYGYYREFTVETAPRVRGPRRIVTGDEEEYYWTDDHYDSFSRILRARP